MRRGSWIGVGLLVGCSVSRAAPSSESEPRASAAGSPPAAHAVAPARAEPPCTPGTSRWCQGREHGGFGIATCGDEGRWSACAESVSGPDGPSDRPSTACACRYPSFDARCCEDQADRDGDGRQDCLVPGDHEPPSCQTDGSLGAYCDADSECGGAGSGHDAALCLLADDGAQVYSFCSRACSDAAPCPEGWACVSVAASGRPTTSQCFPSTARPTGVLPVTR